MRIWTVSNQKGGVGKTTTVVSMAGLLAQAGKPVVLLDLDPHGSLTSYFGLDPDSLKRGVFDLFQHDGHVPEGLAESLLYPVPGEPNIKVMPASTALAVLERTCQSHSGYGLVISRALAQLWDQFQVAIIDTPPQLGVLMVNALAACEKLVIPVQTEFLAIKGLERMLRTLDMINRSRKKPMPHLIVPTLFDRRTGASIQGLRAMRNGYPDNIWRGYIPVDTKFRDASQVGMVPSSFVEDSRGIQAYRVLLKDLMRKNKGAKKASAAKG